MIMTPYDANFRRRKPRPSRMDRRGMDTLESRYNRSLRSAIDVTMVEWTAQLVEYYERMGDADAAQRYADELRDAVARGLTTIANRAVPDWFSAVDRYAANKFNRSLRDALGIDAASILDQSIYDDIHERTIAENVNLIQALASAHYEQVIDAIYDDFEGVGFPGGAKSLAGRIQEITGATKYRASVIARDQTSKLNSQMTQARQEDAGITHYIWRTAGDQRVVGTPGGLYPTGNDKHRNHYERNGKLFAWNDPPSDGHPGESILCRCIAIPQIVPAKLKVVAGESRIPQADAGAISPMRLNILAPAGGPGRNRRTAVA